MVERHVECVKKDRLKNPYDAWDLWPSVHDGVRSMGNAGKEGHKASVTGDRQRLKE
jgi:hypothetical protein